MIRSCEHVRADRAGGERAAGQRGGEPALGVGERDVHGLGRAPGLDDVAVVGQLVRAELDLDRGRRDRDHRDADERLGGPGERLQVDRRDEAAVEAHRLAATTDRLCVVLPRPAHGETLESYPCQRRSSRESRSPSGSGQRWPRRCRAIGHIGLVTVLVGDDPASEVYIRLKHKAALEAGIRRARRSAPGRDVRGRPAREGRGAERRRRDRRDPRPAAAARPHRRGADPARDRPGEGRRRLASVQRRAALPRQADARRRDPGRRDGDAARARHRARRRARRRDRPQRHRRQADGAPADAGERDGDDLPFAHAGPRRGTRSTPTSSSPQWAFRRWSRPTW